jgi:hypothetical protein
MITEPRSSFSAAMNVVVIVVFGAAIGLFYLTGIDLHSKPIPPHTITQNVAPNISVSRTNVAFVTSGVGDQTASVDVCNNGGGVAWYVVRFNEENAWLTVDGAVNEPWGNLVGSVAAGECNTITIKMSPDNLNAGSYQLPITVQGIMPPCTSNAECDDGADCTIDSCTPGQPHDYCLHVVDPTACPDDAIFCNGAETCIDGSCAHSGDPCATGWTCDEDNDRCLPPPVDDWTFTGYACGSDSAPWRDTAANNAITEDSSLFNVVCLDGNEVLSTSSTDINIHSHYVGPRATYFSSFIFQCRLRYTHTGGGFGVTFLSDYNNSDTYYRLRRGNFPGGTSFHMDPHGRTVTGDLVSDVNPQANVWYRFKAQVDSDSIQTRIRGRVWSDGSPEPGTWSIDCVDTGPGNLTSGTIGVWSMAAGTKYWDDFSVARLVTDNCPDDPNKVEPGVCGCNVPDIDTDGDGTLDCLDGCPEDSLKTDPGLCGCGIKDISSVADFDGDCDVDLLDYCRFQLEFTGAQR